MAKKKVSKKNEGNVGESLAVGAAAALAGFAGYYLFGPKGKENRKKVRGWTLKAKGEVLEKIEKLEEVTEDKYHEIVDTVMKKYTKLKSIADEETDKLEEELKKRFKDVARDVEKAAKKRSKSARKKVAKKIEPEKKTTKKKNTASKSTKKNTKSKTATKKSAKK
jgi:gas vesicle protein